MDETHELAVMCDTFHPLENAQEGAGTEEAAIDGDASGAGLTSHF